VNIQVSFEKIFNKEGLKLKISLENCLSTSVLLLNYKRTEDSLRHKYLFTYTLSAILERPDRKGDRGKVVRLIKTEDFVMSLFMCFAACVHGGSNSSYRSRSTASEGW
jgi:hypothetical protein